MGKNLICSKNDVACYSPAPLEEICEGKIASFSDPSIENSKNICDSNPSESSFELSSEAPASPALKTATNFASFCGSYSSVRLEEVFKRYDLTGYIYNGTNPSQLNRFLSKVNEPDFEDIVRNIASIKQFFDRCEVDIEEVINPPSVFVHPYPYALFNTSSEKLNHLFDLFPPEDVWALFHRIRTEEDLDLIIRNKPVIDELKTLYSQLTKKKEKGARKKEDDSLYWKVKDILARTPKESPIKELLENFPMGLLFASHQTKVLELIRDYHDYLLKIYPNKADRKQLFSELLMAFSLPASERGKYSDLENQFSSKVDLFFSHILPLPISSRSVVSFPKVVKANFEMVLSLSPSDFENYFKAVRLITRNARFAERYNDTNSSYNTQSRGSFQKPNFFSGLGDKSSAFYIEVAKRLYRHPQGIELVTQSPDQFLKLLETSSIWADKNEVEKSNLDDFLSSIPKDLLSNRPEILIAIIKKNSTPRVIEIFNALKRVGNVNNLSTFVEYSDTASLNALSLLDYFNLIRYPESKLKRLLKSGEDPTFEDLVTDYRDNKDLRELDSSKKDIYLALMTALRKGLSRLEEEFVKEILSKYPFSFSKDWLTAIREAKEFGNLIHPTIREGTYSIIGLRLQFVNFLWTFWAKSSTQPQNPLKSILQQWYNSRTHRLNVTQNNLAEVNALLDFLSTQDLEILKMDLTDLFPDLRTDKSSAFPEIIASKMDVEEINFSKIKGIEVLADYLELQDRLQRLKIENSAAYLDHKLSELDLVEVLGKKGEELKKEILNVAKIEAIRLGVNAKNKVLGDRFIDDLGVSFLTSQSDDLSSIPATLQFARAWALSDSDRVDRDVQGLYQQYSFFAYGNIANFVKQTLDRIGNDEKEKRRFVVSFERSTGLRFEALIEELGAKGFTFQSQSNFQKGIGRIFSNPSYTLRRTFQKVQGDESVNYNMGEIKLTDSDWPSRDGVALKRISYKNREIAILIKCKRDKAQVEVLAERNGLVKTNDFVRPLGSRYIFSAPMAMTTGERKMTEFAFRKGEQINWLLTPHGKDGLLIVGENGSPKILDKREIKIGDLLEKSDLPNPSIQTACQKWSKGKRLKADCSSADWFNHSIRPFENLWDRNLFLNILKQKRYSLLSGMLLINGNETHVFQDGRTSRRFFVEFNDGNYGIINSSEDMTTGDLVQLSRTVGVKKAIYMDTGMYDQATYRDGQSKDHIIGHPDTNESTNRVVIYSK